MGLFDRPAMPDGSIKDLKGAFLVMSAETREVKTVYGPTTAVDLFIRATDEVKYDGNKHYSGFSAGVVAQVQRAEPNDFPAWAKLSHVDLGKGKSTTELVPVENPPRLDSLPLFDETQGTFEGVDDEDIPF